MITSRNLRRFVAESFGIEGINLYPLAEAEQVAYASSFLDREVVDLLAVLQLLEAIEPTAQLRDMPGMNVRVGSHLALPGGPEIANRLAYMLTELHVSPRRWHIEFEKLHPFTDGNGRVGRMIWLYQMLHQKGYDGGLGFLHMWYYQSFGG